MTLFRNELQNKAEEIKNNLKNLNIDAAYDEESFRDYLVMLDINVDGNKYGKVSVYYKPSKETYSLKNKISDETVSKKVDEAWAKLNGAENYGAESGIYEAFVDGSYISGVTGYGAVIYLGDELKEQISGTILDVEFRQFGGELKSVIEALKWCDKNGVKKVRVNYDYQGIEKFATGEWKGKNNLSKEYAGFVKNIKTQIEWRHIKSHTGNPKNDEADALAKKAATETSSTVSKHFITLEKKALAFIDFINTKENFYAEYVSAQNGEFARMRITDKKSNESGIAEVIYAKANNITIRQHKNHIETEIYGLWQEFLFLQDFGK